jgi:hypothetical protein
MVVLWVRFDSIRFDLWSVPASTFFDFFVPVADHGIDDMTHLCLVWSVGRSSSTLAKCPRQEVSTGLKPRTHWGIRFGNGSNKSELCLDQSSDWHLLQFSYSYFDRVEQEQLEQRTTWLRGYVAQGTNWK